MMAADVDIDFDCMAVQSAYVVAMTKKVDVWMNVEWILNEGTTTTCQESKSNGN